jgi:glycosyltransferase involved in cell wall biosynthesis
MISVCIPTYEQCGYGVKVLKELLNSCFIQDAEFEVIVSDNSKDDKIERLCAQYPLKYVHNSNIGNSVNMNNAIRHSSYEMIKPMCQDDKFLTKTALSDFITALQNKPWAFSCGRRLNDSGLVGRDITPVWNDDILTGPNTLGMPSMMAFRLTDTLFDENLVTRMDCEFYYAMFKKHGVPEIIYKKHIGARYWRYSISSQQGNMTEQEKPYLIKKWM